MPPAGTAERWGYVAKLVFGAAFLVATVFFVLGLRPFATGQFSGTGLFLVSGLLLIGGFYVWDALTWKLSKPTTLDRFPIALFALGFVVDAILHNRPVNLFYLGIGFYLLAYGIWGVLKLRKRVRQL